MRDSGLLIDLRNLNTIGYEPETGIAVAGPSVRGGQELAPFLASHGRAFPGGHLLISAYDPSACTNPEKPAQQKDACSGNQNRLPTPTSLLTPTAPPCASTASLQNARPSPVE